MRPPCFLFALVLLSAACSAPGRPPEPLTSEPPSAPFPRPAPGIPAPVVPAAALPETADRALRERVSLHPEDALAWNAWGALALDAGDPGEAPPRLDRAVELDPEDREIRLNRALARFGLRRYEAASTDFARILDHPVDPPLLTDYDLARREYETRVRAGEIEVDFAEAVRRRLLPVDRAGMFAKWYGRIAGLLARGPGFAKEFRAETDHFMVRTDDSEALARLAAGYLELALGEYRKLFPDDSGRAHPERFPVTIFSRRVDYVGWLSDLLNDRGTAHLSGGSYHPLFKELILTKAATLEQTLLVLLHEGFHQYLDSFVSGVPSWFGEGLADYYGASEMGSGTLIPGSSHPLRVPALKQALRSLSPEMLASILRADAEAFMAARTTEFRSRTALVGRNYAVAWAFAHFLVEANRGEFRPVLARYYQVVRGGAGAEVAYEAVLAPFLATGGWEDFVRYAGLLAGSGGQ